MGGEPSPRSTSFIDLRHDGTRAAWKNVQPLSIQSCEPAANALCQAAAQCDRLERLPQDMPRFFFHGTTMLRGTQAQSRLHVVVEVANCQAGHDLY